MMDSSASWAVDSVPAAVKVMDEREECDHVHCSVLPVVVVSSSSALKISHCEKAFFTDAFSQTREKIEHGMGRDG